MKIWYSEQLSQLWQGYEYPIQVLKTTVNTALAEVRCGIYSALLAALWQYGAVGDHLHMTREAMREHPESKDFSFDLQQSLQLYKVKASQINLDRNVTFTPDSYQSPIKCGATICEPIRG